jgi:argonaute-like protein implicated in RNA metabolism and viral defense
MQIQRPLRSNPEYLIEYPGFNAAYGLPVEIPDCGYKGWSTCPEPQWNSAIQGSRDLADRIIRSIEDLRASYAPHVILIFIPERWVLLRGYRVENERFDLHDFVKAYCVQRGISTQFLEENTLAEKDQCSVWWWLSLALYVKSMRTPWVLESLDPDTAFVGLGFSIDPSAKRGQHVVLGCSHIYSARGEGLQFRLSKIENPIFRGRNAFMSKDDARRLGETIRQLFFDARLTLPHRVVLHKPTPFIRDEREGLCEGLGGVGNIEMIEIQRDNALRYVSSVWRNGRFDEDNFPVRRGTTVKLDDFTALIWVHGSTSAIDSQRRYFQGRRRIPAPILLRRYTGESDLNIVAQELLGLSKMNWNTFDLYTKEPATIHSSKEIARIGSLLERFGSGSYDYRLFM